jgi:hypothetical protein
LKVTVFVTHTVVRTLAGACFIIEKSCAFSAHCATIAVEEADTMLAYRIKPMIVLCSVLLVYLVGRQSPSSTSTHTTCCLYHFFY